MITTPDLWVTRPIGGGAWVADRYTQVRRDLLGSWLHHLAWPATEQSMLDMLLLGAQVDAERPSRLALTIEGYDPPSGAILLSSRQGGFASRGRTYLELCQLADTGPGLVIVRGQRVAAWWTDDLLLGFTSLTEWREADGEAGS